MEWSIGPKRVWKYKLQDIATITGLSIHQIRRRRQNGALNPDSLEDLIRFIVQYRPDLVIPQ